MSAELLLCWYALGWVVCGLVFVVQQTISAWQAVLCVLFAPVMLGFVILHYADKWRGHITPAKQYLWRKP